MNKKVVAIGLPIFALSLFGLCYVMQQNMILAKIMDDGKKTIIASDGVDIPHYDIMTPQERDDYIKTHYGDDKLFEIRADIHNQLRTFQDQRDMMSNIFTFAFLGTVLTPILVFVFGFISFEIDEKEVKQ